MNADKPFQAGEEIKIQVKGVTNDRMYKTTGKILSITGFYAKVRFRRPWAPPHNCMRETIIDLRTAKRMIRRKLKCTL